MTKITNISSIKSLYKNSLPTFLYACLRYWEYPRLERIEKMIPKKGIILDLGSGYGIFSNYLAARSNKRKVIALEFNKKKIHIAEKAAKDINIKNILFTQKDILNIDIPKADVIILMHVLHHVGDREKQKQLISDCVKKLKSGGMLLIDEVEYKFSLKQVLVFLADTIFYLGDKFHYRTRKDMENILKALSLKVEAHNVDGYLMPFPELVYLCKKL